MQFFSIDTRRYHGSGGQLPACHGGGPGSIPGQSHLGFMVDKIALGEVFLPALQFSLSVSFHHCFILIHSSTTHTVLCFSPNSSVFPCQYHSTIAPYSFIHLPPTLYNVFLPVPQFSPVSIIPPLLHTHSFIYHPHSIMFFSQYFSFPLSVSFHHCPILIHPSTTHTV